MSKIRKALAGAAVAGSVVVGAVVGLAPEEGDPSRRVFWFGPFAGETCRALEGDVQWRGEVCFARARSITQDDVLREACKAEPRCRERRR